MVPLSDIRTHWGSNPAGRRGWPYPTDVSEGFTKRGMMDTVHPKVACPMEMRKRHLWLKEASRRLGKDHLAPFCQRFAFPLSPEFRSWNQACVCDSH